MLFPLVVIGQMWFSLRMRFSLFPQKTRNGGEWRNILSDDTEGCIGTAMQQFEYTWFCLKREESQERDTIESKRKLRAEDVLPETSANVVPRVEVERGPWERG